MGAAVVGLVPGVGGLGGLVLPSFGGDTVVGAVGGVGGSLPSSLSEISSIDGISVAFTNGQIYP